MDKMPDVGERLGRFELEQKLGQGNLGMVFLARDKLLDIQVALKVLNPFLGGGQALERLSREVLLARKVSHPGICRIFDIHQENDFLFLTMEYIQGPTLESILDERKSLPAERSAGLVSGIARALAAAHEQDVVHRGLTPRNVVVRPGDQISILDFGLAKSRDLAGTTGAGSPMEAIHYMAPEVITAQASTAQSDIYSLGVILYRCITGSLPFQGKDAVEVTNAVLAGKLVPPRLFNPDVTPALERVITKAVALEPEERYPSMREFREWLVVVKEGIASEAQEQDGRENIPLWHADIDVGAPEQTDRGPETLTQQIRMRDTTLLFSDIIGITKYFDAHGDMAGRKRIQKHNELLFPVIQRNNGTVIKTIGDAIMAYFDQADDGVRAAMEMQRTLDAANRPYKDDEDRIQIRIGLHSGKCIIENQDVFGDAVNVASRVCSKAGAQEILVSSFTRSQLGESLGATRFHSATELKGKSSDFKLFAVQWDPSRVPVTARARQRAAAQETGAEVGDSTEVGTVAAMPAAGREQPAAPGDEDEESQTEVGTVAVLGGPGDRSGVSEISAVEDLPPAEPLVGSDHAPATAVPAPPPVQPTPPARGTRPIVYVVMGAMAALLVVTGAMLIILLTDENHGDAASGGDAPPTSPPPAHAGQADPAAPVTPDPPGADENEKDHGEGLPGDEAPEQDPPPANTDPVPVENDPDDAAHQTDNPGPDKRKNHGGRHTKVAQRAAGRARVDRLRKTIRGVMRKKGIIAGDDRRLDGELQTMKRLRNRRRYGEALAAGKRAQDILEGIRVDKAFIQAKLLRFNKYFDKHSDSQAADRVMELAQDIVAAMESGRLGKANRLLNRSFHVLHEAR